MSEVSDPIFARIAARYDLINRILSLGREQNWRARGIEMLSPGTVLDLGCGTGATDFGERTVVGLDPVLEMLALSTVRDRVAGLGEALPLRDGSVDGVFSGFVFRNADGVVHRIVANDGSFDSGDIAPGATSRSLPAPAAGTNYHCSLHPAMIGAIGGQQGEAPPACTGLYCEG